MARAQKSQRRPDLICADAWRDFNSGPGRAALAALFVEFGLYSVAPDSDPHKALRREGQRDVLMRIIQLIGLKPEMIPEQAWDDFDIVERMAGN